MKIITLLDESRFHVTMEVLKVFGIFSIFEDYEDNIYPVLKDDIHKTTMLHILEFCEYFVDHPFTESDIKRPLPNGGLIDAVPDKWYYEYITKYSFDELHQIIMACSYLGIDSLLSLGCAQIANLIRCKSLEEVQEMFRVGD